MMKTIKNIRWLVLVLLVFACSSDDKKCFIMPDGNVINANSIHEFQNHYNIRFEQYRGFVGDTNERFFNEFVILPSNHIDITSYILNEQEIHETLNEKVVEIRFEKILSVKEKQLIESLQEAYKGENINIRKEEGIYQGLINHQLVFELKYIEFGVPGYFLNIYPI